MDTDSVQSVKFVEAMSKSKSKTLKLESKKENRESITYTSQRDPKN